MRYRKKPIVIEAFQLNERGLVGEDWFWDAVTNNDMVDVEKRKKELHVILAELERDIETLQANISKLREDMNEVNTETDLAAFDEAHDLERGLKHIELYC